MEWTEKAIRQMHRLAEQAEGDRPDPNPTGIYGLRWLYEDAADTIAGAFSSMTPDQQAAAQRFSKRAADAIEAREV